MTHITYIRDPSQVRMFLRGMFLCSRGNILNLVVFFVKTSFNSFSLVECRLPDYLHYQLDIIHDIMTSRGIPNWSISQLNTEIAKD